MSKTSINTTVSKMLELQKSGDSATLIGVGPMSRNCVQAALELSNEMDFPIMFIASRNQVDRDEFGAGYVNGWDQFRFSNTVRDIADEINYTNNYYLCRDHGGPWQRDEERNNHIPEEEAMRIGKKSYLADIEAGFELLMIDPTKDPFVRGKVVPLDLVIDRTVELIEYCEKVRKEKKLPEIGYEVGTEETNGGLTSTEKYEDFIIQLNKKLDEKKLPNPTFIVGQTGTLVRKTEQAGSFNFDNALELAEMAKKYNVGLKEHNGDYLDDKSLLLHTPSKITAVNVAPQYGTEETRALLKLVSVENELFEKGLVKETSNLYNVLLKEAINSERWRKWMDDDKVNISVDEIFENKDLSLEILDIAGHYTFNNDNVNDEIKKLRLNLEENNIDVTRYIINQIKKPIRDYAESFNLKGLTTRIEKQQD